MRAEPDPSRRAVLRGGLVLGGAAAACLAGAPSVAALVRSGRPRLTHGIQSGDPAARGATVWARADRRSRMMVEVSRSPERFVPSGRVLGPVLTAETDYTGKVRLDGLPPGRDIGYRVTLVDVDDDSLAGEPEDGVLRTAPTGRQDIRFVWSGDLAGQGWGINPDFGGYRIFAAMQALTPDFYLCSGDTIYADGPIPASKPLADGSTWRNLTTPETSKVAETLDEFSGNYRYNLMDDNQLRFNAQVAQLNQWDDHETVNNWWPGEILDDPRYTEKRVDVLAARASRAFFEYLPISERPADPEGRIYRVLHYGPLLDVFVLDMKSYRDRNGPNRYTEPRGGILGRRQLDWLQRELAASRATWKVIAADQPLGLVVPDGQTAFEAVAQGDPGRPLGREMQIAELLSFVHRNGIDGLVWLTADVHYTAAHHYDPQRAEFSDFTPFWEFVSGPLNAGGFGPNELDATFGPQVRFQQAPPMPDASPASGYQFFGEVAIDGASGAMTVRLRDLAGRVLYSVDLGT
jgi:alkaline phosphatase D